VELWGISKEQIYAVHALELGSVAPPMPFGTKWCVYRLLDKRVGNLEELPAQRDAYVQQVTRKKQYEAFTRRIEALKRSANVKVY